MQSIARRLVSWSLRHEGVHAAFRRALDGVGRHLAGDEAILGVVLEVAAREGGAVDVHGGSVPAGHVHFIRHLADGAAEALGQVGAPGGGDHDESRAADVQAEMNMETQI